jgi:transcriptional regulator with XRE-family HTH domain
MPAPKQLSPGDGPRAYIGHEMRVYRISAGLTEDELGDELGYSGSYIGAMERGERPPTPAVREAYDKHFQTNGTFTRMKDLLAWELFPGWFLVWLDIERIATSLRSCECLVIPGLLQTEASARALLRAHRPEADEEEIESLVAARLERQEILERKGFHLYVLIDESVLHRPIGSAAAMAEQCDYLVEMAERPNIHVQILPLELGVHSGLAGAFVIAARPDEPPVVYRDMVGEGQVTDDPRFVAEISELWDSLRADALPQRASIELVKSCAERWKSAS